VTARWLVAVPALAGCIAQPEFRGTSGGGPIDCSMANAPDNGTVTFDDGCPAPKMQFEDHCYDLRTDALPWAPSEDDCASTGGYLASVSSGTENTFLLMLNGGGDTYIGGRQMAGATSWPTGEPVTYTNWTSALDGCAQLAPAGWGAIDCAGGFRDRACETPGWTRFEGHEYRHFFTTLDWATASNDCVLRGGHLAAITSDCVADFVFRLAPYHHTFWIGAQRPEGGAFAWVTGTAFEFDAFADGEPAATPGANCVLLDAFTAKWSAADCAQPQGYVCEREP